MKKRTAKSYIDQAEQVLTEEGPGEAIWLLENAFCICKGSKREESSLAAAARQVSGANLARAVEEAESGLRRSLRMLQHPKGMSGEEWIVIIGRLSTAHCVQLLANRTHRSVDIPLMPDAMGLLQVVTEGFRDTGFQQTLADLRTRFPSPLPPPL